MDTFLAVRKFIADLTDVDIKDKIILSQIYSFDRDGKVCWASNETLGKMIDIKPRMVRYRLQSLAAKGYIIIENKGGKNRRLKPGPALTTRQSDAEQPGNQLQSNVATDCQTSRQSGATYKNLLEKIPEKTPYNREGFSGDFAITEVQLPPAVQREDWDRWCQSLKERGIKLTPSMQEVQVEQLREFIYDGHTARDVIKNSIASGYRKLVAPFDAALQKRKNAQKELDDIIDGAI